MNFIKNIVDGKVGEFEHIQFQRFSKGEFKERALINAKRTKDKFTINTSPEFANELVKKLAEKLEKKKTRVTGAIVSTSDLDKEFNFKDKKQFRGVKRYIIDTEMSGEDVLNLLKKFPKTFFALSFEAEDSKLKIKPKAPKSGKPKKGDEKPKADFCKLITTDKEWGESFVFEKPDFNKAEIKHDFFINEIIIPEELKNEKDFAIIREKSKRKGKILRHSKIDDVKYEKEYSFVA